MTTLKLPKSLARYTSGQTEIETEATTLGAALSHLTETFDLGSAVLQDGGAIQPYIGVVLGGRLLDKATLADASGIDIAGQTVQLKTAFAGG